MRIKEAAFTVFLGIARLLWGKGLGRIPMVGRVYDFLFSCLRPTRLRYIEIEGNVLYVYPGDVDRRLAHGASLYLDPADKLLTPLMKSEIKPGMTVLDLGANVGFYSLLAAKLVGETGRVVSFEPAPDSYALLLRNVTLNGYQNVHALQIAVSDKSGPVSLFLNKHSSGRHNIYDHYGQKQGVVLVDAVSLDDFFKGEDTPIHFIKMDIEGAEMAAIRGMSHTIKRNKSLRLVAEFNPNFLSRVGVEPEELLSLLTEYGFELFHMDDEKGSIEPCSASSLMEACTGGRHTNLFAVKEE